jgi:adenosylcobinamide-GDP ribazoletransferase
VGAGGIAAGTVTTLLLFAGLMASGSIVSAIIIGEVCAKFSMVVLTTFGKPFREGIHGYLHQFSRPYFPVIAAMLCLPLAILPVSLLELCGAAMVMILCPIFLLIISKRLFGGVNGDVVGASNEITRACAIIIVALI